MSTQDKDTVSKVLVYLDRHHPDQAAIVRAMVAADMPVSAIVGLCKTILAGKGSKEVSERDRALSAAFARASGFISGTLANANQLVGKVESGPNEGKARTAVNLYDTEGRGTYTDTETGDVFGFALHNVSEMRRRAAERKSNGSNPLDEILSGLEDANTTEQ